jgi:hypothetical protein
MKVSRRKANELAVLVEKAIRLCREHPGHPAVDQLWATLHRIEDGRTAWGSHGRACCDADLTDDLRIELSRARVALGLEPAVRIRCTDPVLAALA